MKNDVSAFQNLNFCCLLQKFEELQMYSVHVWDVYALPLEEGNVCPIHW